MLLKVAASIFLDLEKVQIQSDTVLCKNVDWPIKAINAMCWFLQFPPNMSNCLVQQPPTHIFCWSNFKRVVGWASDTVLLDKYEGWLQPVCPNLDLSFVECALVLKPKGQWPEWIRFKRPPMHCNVFTLLFFDWKLYLLNIARITNVAQLFSGHYDCRVRFSIVRNATVSQLLFLFEGVLQMYLSSSLCLSHCLFVGQVMSQFTKIAHWLCSKCICHCLYHCICLFIGNVMSPNHSDQMSQMSQVVSDARPSKGHYYLLCCPQTLPGHYNAERLNI